MSYDNILNGPHKELIDRAIDAGYPPSVIREGLVREGIDAYTQQEIAEYVEHYLQEVLNRSLQEQKDLFSELNSSLPALQASNIVDETKKLNYFSLLELDALRAEKFIQMMMRGEQIPVNIQNFEKLAKIKQNVVTSLTTLMEYKKAIQEAQNAQFNSTRVDMDRLTPFLSQLSDTDRDIALDVMNLIMESKTEEVSRFLPNQ